MDFCGGVYIRLRQYGMPLYGGMGRLTGWVGTSSRRLITWHFGDRKQSHRHEDSLFYIFRRHCDTSGYFFDIRVAAQLRSDWLSAFTPSLCCRQSVASPICNNSRVKCHPECRTRCRLIDMRRWRPLAKDGVVDSAAELSSSRDAAAVT